MLFLIYLSQIHEKEENFFLPPSEKAKLKSDKKLQQRKMREMICWKYVVM